jgi:hypothetical protein
MNINCPYCNRVLSVSKDNKEPIYCPNCSKIFEEYQFISWKEICMRILAGISEHQGYYFSKHWKLDQGTIEMIEEEFAKWDEK